MSQQLAQAMWDRMESALSALGGLPVGYRGDVYDVDRKSVGAIWAPNSTYVWLVREMGSHLSRVGVVAPQDLDVYAALKHFDLRAQRHGLWRITTDASGASTLRSIGVADALVLCGRRHYQFRDGRLTHGQQGVSLITLTHRWKGPGVREGILDIRSAGGAPSREATLASYQVGLSMLKASDGLFARMASATVDGASMDRVAPVYTIALKDDRQGHGSRWTRQAETS